MKFTGRSLLHSVAIAALALSGAAQLGFAQVNPAEIRDPQLKALESAHLHQLSAANRDIQGLKFPFRFVLSRYVGLDPKQEIGVDTRGLEFVKFHDETLLKVTGNYNAAYNAGVLTDNQRVSRVVEDVLSPLLGVVSQDVPPSTDFSRLGFEVSFHVRRREAGYDYEGKQILVLVMDRGDAMAYLKAQDEPEKQRILDRSEVYLNGKAYGPVLGERDPYPVNEGAGTASSVAAKPASVGVSGPAVVARTGQLPPVVPESAPARPAVATAPVPPAPNAQNLADLQAHYRAELDALNQEGRAHFHFVDYAPPDFVMFRNQVYLQATLRNPAHFDTASTSIYRRAARTFDLFLAPALKPLLAKVPVDPRVAGLDITVLVEGVSQSAATSSSEAIEFLCPAQAVRRFAEAEITNQDLIDQSVVLVNGVRIALALQQVE